MIFLVTDESVQNGKFLNARFLHCLTSLTSLAYVALADRIISSVINWEDLERSCRVVSPITIRRTVSEVLLTVSCFGRNANCSWKFTVRCRRATHPPDNSHKHSSTKHTYDRRLNNMCIKMVDDLFRRPALSADTWQRYMLSVLNYCIASGFRLVLWM